MDTGMPPVNHFAKPRAATIVPSVAINGGMAVNAISEPFSMPINKPTVMPARIGHITGRSVSAGNTARGKSDTCARLAETTAVAATTEPEERSMPLVMMTMFTPTAMMPTTDICRMMICSRSILKIKL